MEIKTETRIIQYVEVDGHRFYKDGRGYWQSSKALARSTGRTGTLRLHVYMWEKHNGPIPEGYEVHHIDRNPGNNDIENLRLMTAEEHRDLHNVHRKLTGVYPERLPETALSNAAVYHISEVGREWHREHYKKTLAPRHATKIKKKCIVCSSEFECSLTREDSKYCSSKCKERARPKRRPPTETRICSMCGSEYNTSIYSPSCTCSKPCAMDLRSLRHKGAGKNGKS